MLGSITPLGERGRGSRWWLTVSAYVVGSVVGGAAIGGVLGAAGVAIGWSSGAALIVLGVAAVVGLALDTRLGGLRLPTVRRQVDEEWRSRYRGWVWGVAFGFQLALGVVTIVTTSLVYVTLLAAFVSGSIAAGVSIGVAFGLARAAPVFSVARVRRPEQLVDVDETLRHLADPARRAAIAAGGTVALVAVVGALR
jgi:MFS family permease